MEFNEHTKRTRLNAGETLTEIRIHFDGMWDETTTRKVFTRMMTGKDFCEVVGSYGSQRFTDAFRTLCDSRWNAMREEERNASLTMERVKDPEPSSARKSETHNLRNPNDDRVAAYAALTAKTAENIQRDREATKRVVEERAMRKRGAVRKPARMAEYVEAKSILSEAERLTSSERRADYGHPTPQHARFAKMVEAILDAPCSTVQAEAIMVALKLSRAAQNMADGKAISRDTLIDMAGYVRLMDISQNEPAN